VFFLFVRYVLVDSLGTSFGLSYLSVRVNTFCILYCVVCVLTQFSNSPYFFAAVCKGDRFCFVVLWVSVFCFCGEGYFDRLCYNR
jgi:hypothetical protein